MSKDNLAPSCSQCEAMRRVVDATQKGHYEADKARIEAEDRARRAETTLAQVRAACSS